MIIWDMIHRGIYVVLGIVLTTTAMMMTAAATAETPLILEIILDLNRQLLL